MSTGRPHHYGHLLQVKKNLFEVWFYTIFFHDFIHVYSPGAGQTAPRGQSFEVNRNVLSLQSFVASFKKMSMKSDFIQFFSWFNTCIQPRGRGRQPPGEKFWCLQKGLITLPISCRFQRDVFEKSDFIHFFHELIHVCSPRGSGIQPPGNKVLTSLWNFLSLRSSVDSFKS